MRNKVFSMLLIVMLSMVISPALAQVETDNPLLRLLKFVPDTVENRQFVTYGDLAAWHESWGIPRIDSLDDLENLPREQSAYWIQIMPNQTVPPQALGLQYLRVDDLRGFYGFDIFQVDRYLQAAQPPDLITVVEYGFPDEQITDALTASGYTEENIASGRSLYSILGDYEIDLAQETISTSTGRLGDLNRIAVLDGQMVIAKATDVVNSAIEALAGDVPSLADDPYYAAAVTALDDPALSEMGELVGAILMDGSQLADPMFALPANISPELVEQLMQGNEDAPDLPLYNVVVFGTRHSPGASHLILSVAFPEGADAKTAANALAERIGSYRSLVTDETLEDRWTVELATGTKVGDIPVALVSMRVDDPLPASDDTAPVSANVWNWLRMVVQRDLLFLSVTG